MRQSRPWLERTLLQKRREQVHKSIAQIITAQIATTRRPRGIIFRRPHRKCPNWFRSSIHPQNGILRIQGLTATKYFLLSHRYVMKIYTTYSFKKIRQIKILFKRIVFWGFSLFWVKLLTKLPIRYITWFLVNFVEKKTLRNMIFHEFILKIW